MWLFKIKETNTPEINSEAIRGLIESAGITMQSAPNDQHASPIVAEKAAKDALLERIQDTLNVNKQLIDKKLDRLLFVVMQTKLYLESSKRKKNDLTLIACEALADELAGRIAARLQNQTISEFLEKKNKFIEEATFKISGSSNLLFSTSKASKNETKANKSETKTSPPSPPTTYTR